MAEQYIDNEKYLYNGGIFLAILCITWYFRHLFRLHISGRIYAWIINKDASYLNGVFWKEKVNVFKILHEHGEKINKDLKILDVGSGPGINLPFLPDNSKLVCLDPNPNFRGCIEQKLMRCDNVVETDFVQGSADDMPFESESFDAVISFLVLCVVNDIDKSLEEMKRVLKPGGKMFFLQHIIPSDSRPWKYVLHCAWVPLARLLFSCHLTRDTVKSIKNAGFSDVDLHHIYPKAVSLPLKTCVIGVATK